MARLSAAVAFALALLLAGCSQKNGPADAANAFFKLIGEGKAQQAYDSTTFAFQAQQNAKYFEQTAKELDFTNFASTHWEAPEIKDDVATLSGEVIMKSGKSERMVITLKRESGAWRIFTIKRPRDMVVGAQANLFSGVGKSIAFSAPVDRAVPDTKTLNGMVTRTLLEFDDAVQRKSFDDFYADVSRAWQKRLTVGQLQRTFQPFIDKQVTIAGIRGLEPKYDREPFIGTDGLLTVSGSYPTQPYRVVFSMKFTYELPQWRLYALEVTLMN